jgi:ferredoxin
VTDAEERRLGDIVVRIDRLLCVGFEDCIQEAVEVFELDGDGVAVFREGAGGADRDRVVAACEACPVDALTAFDLEGHQLVP